MESDADSGRMSSSTLNTELDGVDCSIALIEPFYGGSHKQLIDLLEKSLSPRCSLYTTPDKKWHWKARTSALYFAEKIPKSHRFRTLFASSVLNLAEFIGLREDFRHVRKVLYFHENQLVYPLQEDSNERDFQYGYNQIMSALVADVNVFNSKFNLDSFLENIPKFLSKIPSPRSASSETVEKIRKKCMVLYFPLDVDELVPFTHRHRPAAECRLLTCPQHQSGCSLGTMVDEAPLHIVWPHRWEHDKNPGLLVSALEELHEEGCGFFISIIGQNYSEIPSEFRHGGSSMTKHIKHWGFLPRDEYYKVLGQADVVVSTANHEFFGVSVLEAVYFGCYPLVPKHLVYPEIYKDPKYLYDPAHPSSLAQKLRIFCANPMLARSRRPHMDISRFQWSSVKRDYLALFKTSRSKPAI